MTVHSIRVFNYCGDYDDLNALHIIGPYDTAAGRDRDLARLAGLPDVHGSLEFSACRIHPDVADRSCRPEAVADAADLDQILAAL